LIDYSESRSEKSFLITFLKSNVKKQRKKKRSGKKLKAKKKALFGVQWYKFWFLSGLEDARK